ncbi:MAG: DUF1559 domain-containing protein, partial [Planctomycetales bacterium]
MRNVAIALYNHDSTRGFLPRRRERMTDPNGNRKDKSWVYHILPFIERRDLWEKYGPQSPTGNFNSNPTEWMKVMTCPNDPTARTGNKFTMVVNGGTRGNSDNQSTAMFDDSWNGSITACSAGDGTSQTILLSENVDASNWRDLNDEQVCVCFQDSAIGFGGTVKNINVDL